MSHWFTQDRQTALYQAASVRRLDQQAIQAAGIPGLELMRRAGACAWQLLRRRWPDARRLAVLCGPGNNGGDGLVLARLAANGGVAVHTCLLGDPANLKGDAASSYQDFRAAGLNLSPCSEEMLLASDGIVDALYGTGLARPVTGRGASLIEAVNRHPGFRLSLDIPSGLHADSGRIQGCAIHADATVTFIGVKQGLCTGQGREQCGELVFEDLGVPEPVYRQVDADAWRINLTGLKGLLGPRERDAHKGRYGHVLVIGGDHGYAGATALCAQAALKTGAGLLTVASRPQHLAVVNGACRELMFRGITAGGDLVPLLSRATVIAIGPGLGRGEWSRELLATVLAADGQQGLVVDADALNLLAEHPPLLEALQARAGAAVCTPHPGEAARLLAADSQILEADRFAASARLARRLGTVVVLKGAGTLIQALDQPPLVCAGGNPGMASGGMGDVLTGVIAALLAQGLGPEQAAAAGCVLHAAAGDEAALAGGGERGLLASDLMAPLRRLVNRL